MIKRWGRWALQLARHVIGVAQRRLTGGAESRNWLLILSHTRDVRKIQRIEDRLRFYAATMPADTAPRVATSASVLDLLSSTIVAEADSGVVSPRWSRLFPNVFDLDYDRNKLDGWELCRVTQFLAGFPSGRRRADSLRRFRKTVEQLKKRGLPKTYVFGTGPSLAAAENRSFEDGNVVVCNTIVRDERLWRHLRPDIVTAGDAIYHFGHTSHARAFRSDLKRRLAESNGRTVFVYPELFDALVLREFGDQQESLVPIPLGSHTEVNIDLCARFELPSLGNVLNLLLLPLACTLTKDVRLWGFDGRAPEDKLFWANSKGQAYPELMGELQAEHPAFFAKFVPKGEEHAYVNAVHGDDLDERLKRAEAQGWTFKMLHFSWTETLQKRFAEPSA